MWQRIIEMLNIFTENLKETDFDCYANQQIIVRKFERKVAKAVSNR